MFWRTLFLLAFLILTGCAGASGTSPIGAPQRSQAALGPGTARFTIRVPNAAQSSNHSHRYYISPNTGSLLIHLSTVNGATNTSVADVVAPLTSTSPGCSASAGYTICTVASAATIGNDAYTLTLYQSTDGSGTALATASATVDVVEGVAASVNVTFGGVPATLVLSRSEWSSNSVTSPQHDTFTIEAEDASGAAIVPPGNYSSPISITRVSGSGTVTITPTSFASPGPSGTETATLTIPNAALSALFSITAGSASATASVDYLSLVGKTVLLTGGAQTTTVSETNYSGAFTVTPDTSVTVSCTPANCTPTSAGGSVTLTITPTGTITDENSLTVADSYGTTAHCCTVEYAQTAYTGLVDAPYTAIVAGPDGNIWLSSASGFVKVTTAGVASAVSGVSYSVPQSSIAVDGSFIWFEDNTTSHDLIRMSASGTTTTYSGAFPTGTIQQLIKGPDGNLWFVYSVGAGAGNLGKLTTSGTLTTYAPPSGGSYKYLASGTDGNLWVSDNGSDNTIDKVSTGGTVLAEYAAGLSGVGGSPLGLIEGSNNVFVYDLQFSNGSLATMTMSGTVAQSNWADNIESQASYSNFIIGPDTNVWFIDPVACCLATGVARISPSGAGMASYDPVVSGVSIVGLIAGSDGNIWYIDADGNLIKVTL